MDKASQKIDKCEVECEIEKIVETIAKTKK